MTTGTVVGAGATGEGKLVSIAEWTEKGPSEDGVPVLVTKELPGGLVAHAQVVTRSRSAGVVCFLPGARARQSPRRVPFLHRWSWHTDLDDYDVIAVGDPSVAVDERLLGGWFMHAEVDIIAELAGFLDQLLATLDHDRSRLTTYGSSLGGFGAVALAAHLPGARAVAEIPQIDVARWPIRSAQVLLEEVLAQEPLAKFRERFPERVDLLDRLRFAGAVPPITLVTNSADDSYADQCDFIGDAYSLARELPSLGVQRLVHAEDVLGHKALPKDLALALIRTPDRSPLPHGLRAAAKTDVAR